MLKTRREFLWVALLALVILGGGLIISGALRGQTVYASEGQGAPPALAAMSPQTEEEKEEGVVIVAVEKDSPAERADVKRGDILLALDGELVSDPWDVMELLACREPGDEVTLRVRHGDEERLLTAVLEGREDLTGEERAYLGIQMCPPLPGAFAFVTTSFGLEGALVVEVKDDSPAAAAGLRPGDVILAVDGQKVSAKQPLVDLIRRQKPGDEVELEVRRDGDRLTMRVTLGSREEEGEQVAYLGVWVAPWPAMHIAKEKFLPKPFLPLPEDHPEEGIMVLKVAEESPAAEAGLKRGDLITAVDGEKVKSLETFRDWLRGHKPGDEVTLTVYREEEEWDIVLKLGREPGKEDGEAYLGVDIFAFFQGYEWDKTLELYLKELKEPFGEERFFFYTPPPFFPFLEGYEWDGKTLKFYLKELKEPFGKERFFFYTPPPFSPFFEGEGFKPFLFHHLDPSGKTV